MSYAMPRIGTSLSLIAVGAILRYAVTASVTGVALTTVGLILMIIGGVGLAISLALVLMRLRGSSRATNAGAPLERVVERDRYYDQ
jgi:hypothetical protein